MDPFKLATACYAVLSTCLRVSRRLNRFIEDSRNVDDLITHSLEQTQCLYRILRSINTTILNNPTSITFLNTDNDAGTLRDTMAQAITGSGAAVDNLETILNGIMPSPKAPGVARKALASQRLKEKTNEILHIRQQMQTYAGILQMALQTITVSLLLQNVGTAAASPRRLTSKVSKLVRSIHHAEQSLAYPRTSPLGPDQVAQFGICTQSAHAVLSSASSVLGHAHSPARQSSHTGKSDTLSEWGFTFLESESSDAPVLHVDLGQQFSLSRTEAWITQRDPSEILELDGKSSAKSVPSGSSVYLEDENWFLSQPDDRCQVYWDDSSSSSSSEDDLNLDAGLYLIFMDLGDQSLAEDRFSQAETYFRKALDRVQSSSTLHDGRLVKQKIGVACLEQGKYDEAKAVFDEHPDLARSVIERIFAKARSFYEAGQYQDAINVLERALTDTHDAPEDVVREMRMLSGLAHLASNKLAQADEQFSLVLLPEGQQEDSRSLEAHHNLALVHLRQGQTEKAIAHAQTASKGRWRLFSRDHAVNQESLAVLIDAFEAKGDTEEVEAYTKLLTEENLKKRTLQSKGVTLRKRFLRLRKRDRILAAMDENLFASEIESFVNNYLTSDDDLNLEIENESLLLAAARESRSVIVRALLRDSRLDVRTSDASGDTALHHSIRNASEEIVILLLRQVGTGVNHPNERGETPLAIATQDRNESMVKLLLQCTRVNPNLEVRKLRDSKTVSHGPALHIAVVNKADSIVELFIQHAANLDLNYRDAHGRTPLHYAVLSGNVKICEMLLQQSSVRLSPVTDPEKQSLLSLAITSDMPKLAHQLIAKKEVDVNTQDHQGHTALHHSVWCNQPAILEHLLQRTTLDVNLKDLCGRTALHVAAACGNAKLVKILVGDTRTDVDCKTNYGESPVSAAFAAKHKPVIAVFERRLIEMQIYGKVFLT